MSARRRLGIFGGTFDPIHLGHVEAAVAASQAVGFGELRLLPSRLPPHRPQEPCASGYHRFAMVALAVRTLDRVTVSDLELMAPGRSYTSQTLVRLLAAGHDPAELFFVTGADAFAEIASWKDYPALLDRCHFVVITRPGHGAHGLARTLPELSDRMIELSPSTPLDRVADTPAIYLADACTADVSSTDVRRRAARGASLEGLVPADVATYIRRQGLYGSGTSAADLHV